VRLLRRSEIDNIVEVVRPYTMVCDDGVAFTVKSAVEAVESGIPGDMVECGTWRGGCGLAMMMAQREAFGRVERTVHFFDSFEGLPPVEQRDGPAARQWQASTADNCVASREELVETLNKFHFAPTEYVIWPGMFEDTLPCFLTLTSMVEHTIALLRLDGDWYASTETCLRLLMPRVADSATVIVDDYYAWDGCARAVHDYMSRNDLPYRIKSLSKNTGAYFVKQRERDYGQN
jgi:hypothetical protein